MHKLVILENFATLAKLTKGTLVTKVLFNKNCTFTNFINDFLFFYLMKALILAAGYATRLYPLTLDQPKPLLQVGEKKIVEHIVSKLEKLDVDTIYIITNDKFYGHFCDWEKRFVSNKNIKIINDQTISNENRLGAIGDINYVVEQEKIDDDLLVIGGDNLFEDDLSGLINCFNEKGSSILLNDVGDKELARLYGIVSLGEQGQIVKFVEKPLEPESTLASTLIYLLQKEHLPLLAKSLELGQADRAGDFIKYLSEHEKVFGLSLEGRWFDIGSMEQLKEAEEVYGGR